MRFELLTDLPTYVFYYYRNLYSLVYIFINVINF